MLITRSITKTLRRYSAAAVVQALDSHNPSYSYLPGYPRPDPKHAETISAIPRVASGTNISNKLRKTGLVPSIVFDAENGQNGGNKMLVSVRNNQIKNLVRALGTTFFLSRLFELQVKPDLESGEVLENVRVLPRLLHLNPATDAVLNVTFIRAPSSALLKVDVPLLFRGDDISPGLKKGSYLNIIERTVKYLCPADIIPPYIEVDLSEMDVGHKLEMGDLKVHPALKLLQPPKHPLVKIAGTRASADKKAK